MFKVNGLLFRNVKTLAEYLQQHAGEEMVVTYVTSYALGDPMEQ